MPRINDQVAAAFNELADLMEISGADRFRVLAYRRVASEIGAQARDLTAMSDKELSSLRGVGKATAGKIEEFLETGTMRKLEDARASVPPGLVELTALPGLGPKTALLIHQELGVASIADLKEALKGERIRTIRGLGPKTEETLSRSLKHFASGERRIDLEKALLVADSLLEPLRSAGIVGKAEYAGSLRRMRETIGDIDILVASRDPKQVGALFGSMDTVSETRAAGGTKTTIITTDGMQADLRVVAPDEFGAALQYFTGSKEHNVRVREIAVKKGMKLSEYGLFKVEGAEKIAGKTESEVYEALGMQMPPPTMRENHGEIELALSGNLPRLIEPKNVRGDLHSHSRYSDGMSSIHEMASAAADLGYEYYAITDHGGSNHVRSVSPEHLEKQIEEVQQVRGQFAGRMTILHGMELDIGAKGDLTFPEDLLKQLDLVIMSVHDSFDLERDAMTTRLLRAMEHPFVNIFGHPTARRIGSRSPIEFDMEKVFNSAKERGVALEINSTPKRLDLKDDHIRLGRDLGCRFAINTDSHGPSRLERMRLGVGMAQRGWLTASDVINTWTLAKLKQFLAKA